MSEDFNGLDLLTNDHIVLPENEQTDEAARAMVHGRADFAIVRGRTGHAVAIVSRAHLAQYPARHLSEMLRQNHFGPMPVADISSPVWKDRRALALMLGQNPSAPGIVAMDGDTPLGIAPAKNIHGHREDFLTPSLDSLGGQPDPIIRVFTCPNNDYSVVVATYDPSSPPTCPNDGKVLV
ncbi:hypothetical protein CCAX7_57010 [Capsulimonas corticalis]|uniref:Uncharacterized protein n=1 Tax=Capsulimonas corticalis TaxID=2219043 RepID=A0A402D0C8_9BACT|nr:hypothetical protein [Capsulimonas corticalis]BDI33650.1 hypothetical protein CCAX7_57010 [Capsulimonas corticalis]